VPPVGYQMPIDTGVVPDNDEAYRKLLSKTDFGRHRCGGDHPQVPGTAQGHPGHRDAPNIKFKTAVLAGSGTSRIDARRHSGGLRHAESQTAAEEDAFKAKAQQYVAREITGRQDTSARSRRKITQLQQQLAQLSGELVEAQGKSAHVQSQFAAGPRNAAAVKSNSRRHNTPALLKG